MPRSRDLEIFVPTTTTDDYFTPCACARGNYASATSVERLVAIVVRERDRVILPNKGGSIIWELYHKDTRLSQDIKINDTK